MQDKSAEAKRIHEAEQAFDKRRRTFGLIFAPILAVTVFFLPIDALSPEAHKLLAIMVLVGG